jgi:hypothetical protein
MLAFWFISRERKALMWVGYGGLEAEEVNGLTYVAIYRDKI